MPTIREQTSRFLGAWMHVRQIVQAANFNQFHRAGLSATQFMLLNVVPKEGLTLTELARKLNLSPASLNKTVDSLEDRGLVIRVKRATDARKLDIITTAKGRRLQNQSSDDFHRFMGSLFKAMSADERAGLLAGLERLVQLSPASSAATHLQGVSVRAGSAPPVKRSSRRSPVP